MITITIMLVAIIEVLDMTIVNVALPPMMGALGTTSDKITWVLTSYIVTSAIFMLLTGFLDERLGRKKLLVISIIGFMLASALCGTATTLDEIVFFRSLQGIFGASLVPLSQTVLRTTFPPEEQGKAMAIWGIGIMVAPVLGPTLGGFITEHTNWRWVFYINIPVCTLSFFMALRFIKNTIPKKRKVDWFGAGLLALGVGAFQIFLDQGNNEDWFQSKMIILLLIIAVMSITLFVIRGLNNPYNIINFKIFKDRNFVTSTLMLSIFMLGVLGVISIQPILLENYFGYPPEFTGLVMAPRGIAAAIGMMFTGIFMAKVDPKKIMLIALVFAITGSYMMSTYSLTTSAYYWIWSGVVQGLGMGLFLVPLSTLSLITLSPEDTAGGAGLFSFSRNLGMSIGISIISTIIARETQINWNRLGEHINPFNENLQIWLHHQGWTLHTPTTLATLQKILAAQAGMVAFIDSFWLISLMLILLIPLVFFIKTPKLSKSTPMAH